PDHAHHVRFPVHGPGLREPRRQRERELAGPAGQVEQPATAGYRGALDQVPGHGHRIGEPVAVVVPGGPLVEVSREPRFVARHVLPFPALGPWVQIRLYVWVFPENPNIYDFASVLAEEGLYLRAGDLGTV